MSWWNVEEGYTFSGEREHLLAGGYILLEIFEPNAFFYSESLKGGWGVYISSAVVFEELD